MVSILFPIPPFLPFMVIYIVLYYTVFIVSSTDPNIMDIEHVTIITYQGKAHK
jgi:hypothetical protein